jgi:hypothetical protein
MKKILTWFHILKDLPSFNEADPTQAPAAEAAPAEVEEPVAEVVAAEPEPTPAPKAKAKKTTKKAE